jgi:hypothetical protein
MPIDVAGRARSAAARLDHPALDAGGVGLASSPVADRAVGSERLSVASEDAQARP